MYWYVFLWLIEGARRRGRSKTTWKDVIEGDVKSLKINETNLGYS